MGCCGKKREMWLEEIKGVRNQKTVENDFIPSETKKPNKIFEYTGNGSLTIIGVISGKSYHFKGKGNRIEVDYSDSFALMGETDLRALSIFSLREMRNAR